jgi:hypothetical protein
MAKRLSQTIVLALKGSVFLKYIRPGVKILSASEGDDKNRRPEKMYALSVYFQEVTA